MKVRVARGCVAIVATLVAGCASATDVERRGRAVLEATDPEQLGYCPARDLALARVEVAIARAAASRGESLAAAGHIAAAEDHAARAKAQAAGCIATPAKPPDAPSRVAPPPVTSPERPDRDHDGFSDAIDQCPDQAEDLDGYEDLDGCPEPGP